MSAEDTRKKSLSAHEARRTSVQSKNHTTETEHLLNHFQQLIHKASNQGKFEVEKQHFANDRFRQSTIDEVILKLEEDGYKVSLGKNNALHQITFSISW